MSNLFLLFQILFFMYIVFIKNNAKNYLIFYFFLSLFILYTQTKIICEKKNIYGHILYIIIYIYI